MEYKDVVHKVDEFHLFPWKDPRFNEEGKWTYGRGGHGFNSYVWHITLYDDNANMEVWELPEIIWRIIRLSECHGANEVRRDINNALAPTSYPKFESIE